MKMPSQKTDWKALLTHICLRIHIGIVVWVYHIGNNLEIENDFTKYLMESRWYYYDYHTSFNNFPNHIFALNISSR